MGGYIVAVVFWIFVGTTAVTGMVLDHKKKRLGVDLLRAAVERGQQLDPAMIEKVMAPAAQGEDPFDPLALRIGGVITIACSIGALIVAVFIAQVFPQALYIILAGGCLGICLGIGLMIGARMVVNSQSAQRDP